MPIDEQALADGIKRATLIVRRLHDLEERAAGLRILAEKAQADFDAAMGDAEVLRHDFRVIVNSFLP